MSGEDIAAEVSAALAEVGQEVGSGVAYVATLVKPQFKRKPWDADPGGPSETTLNIMVSEYDKKHIDGTRIRVGDKLLVVESIGVVPEPGDYIVIDETEQYSVIDVDTLAPGGVDILYEVQGRIQPETN